MAAGNKSNPARITKTANVAKKGLTNKAVKVSTASKSRKNPPPMPGKKPY